LPRTAACVPHLVQQHARTSGRFYMAPRKSICSEAVCILMPARPLEHTSCCVSVWVVTALPCVVGRRTGNPRHLRRCALCRQELGDEKHLILCVYRFHSYSLSLPASVPTWLYNVVVYEPGCAKGCYVFCHGLFTVLFRERSKCVLSRTLRF
jgi:hypothetical protein